ncbi:uncharacterized protein LOC108031312 [Drosophila biarmipes]|uniref:uncharacterized protein LOC108031312 n=1 Tax=Drosophila biarmipes TaxID=125945 RepID=UPI0007E8AEA7|nr:uncharacterized protein LOC108031312 [Drosophila biarmipes]
MAPFSACSICQARTRKMVKDPLTLKQIYVCPKCFKSEMHKKASPIEGDNSKKSGNAKMISGENQMNPDKEPGVDKKATTKSTRDGKSQKKEGELIKDLPKVKIIPKITPPLMQTVVIKNRKYVAVSETADDE